MDGGQVNNPGGQKLPEVAMSVADKYELKLNTY